ncbi:uncharacterized protein [Amphiura filiformis]|uniref:uncharacterized protein n=1 Tax=Amphiura filiformis TaxID=82378 RepID=UPI003B22230D
MLKSRAKLGKQGALAQRRKPTKQDPSKRQTWMFGDPNDTSHLLGLEGIEEEAEKSHTKAPRHSEPYDLHRHTEEESTSPSHKLRKPVGGIGGPMLLAGLGGLGGPHMLKKTPKKSPLEDKPLSLPTHDDEPPIPRQSSPVHKTSPPKTKTDPLESTKPPAVKSQPPKPTKPKPARPTPASRPLKPKPKPRHSTGEELNHEILNAQMEEKEEVPKVPAWMADAKKRLPPISPRTEEDSTVAKETKPGKKPVPIPQWKQELLKKKKDGVDTAPKRHSMPPPVAKKPDLGTVPFTTMPQWQVDLAEKKTLRKQKEADIGSKEESPKVPAWKREAAERAARVQKAQEEKAKKDKEREEKMKKEKEEKEKLEKEKKEKEKKEESAPLSTMQTTSSTSGTIIKTAQKMTRRKTNLNQHNGRMKTTRNKRKIKMQKIKLLNLKC